MTGAVLIIPSHRLAPEHPWPAAIDDEFSVYRELCDKPFAVVGDSAGGNLVLAARSLAWTVGMPPSWMWMAAVRDQRLWVQIA